MFEQIAPQAMDAFLERFYREDEEGKAGLVLGEFFWCKAEIFEVVIDAFEQTGEERYRILMRHMFDGFLLDEGDEWSHNPFNDDIAWITIGCARAYLLTGEEDYLGYARHHFEVIWERAYSADLGGGLFWRIENRSKNACINGPAAIAACLLYQSTKEERYLDIAGQVYDWECRVLLGCDGAVRDNIKITGEVWDRVFTYNQGTFIGASVLLYQATGEQTCLDNAVLAADYTMNVLAGGNVLTGEAEGGDQPGFKGILTRWMAKLAALDGMEKYAGWLLQNARTAWGNRNSRGLVWTNWEKKTLESDEYSAWGCSAAVALFFQVISLESKAE